MMPVREAIRRLAALDLVEIEPRKGARVRELSLDDLEDTYFARLHLENAAVWEAAQQFTAADADRARAALKQRASAQDSGDPVAARDAHEKFHFTIYEASQRTWLVRSILPAWRNSERYRIDSMRHTEAQESRDHEHSQILRALTDHDSVAAVRWMTTHLLSSVSLSAQHLAAQTGQQGRQIRLPSVDQVIARMS